MPELMLLGSAEQLRDLDPDENPADTFPCFPCEKVHLEARAQLYARLLGIFFDEALALEELVREMGSYGPFVYRLNNRLLDALAATQEDCVAGIADGWAESADMETLGVYDTDLLELLTTFLFNLINFCLTATQEPD